MYSSAVLLYRALRKTHFTRAFNLGSQGRLRVREDFQKEVKFEVNLERTKEMKAGSWKIKLHIKLVKLGLKLRIPNVFSIPVLLPVLSS